MCRYAFLAVVSAALMGCGDGLAKYPTAKATGKVMCNGQPVPHVRVLFAPMEMKTKTDSGKPGEGLAGADGTFTLSTYHDGDGAVVGKHEVRVDSPPSESHPDFKCDCGINAKVKVTEVEVKATGENNFTINLLTKQQLGQQMPARMKQGLSKDELRDEMESAAASK